MKVNEGDPEISTLSGAGSGAASETAARVTQKGVQFARQRRKALI